MTKTNTLNETEIQNRIARLAAINDEIKKACNNFAPIVNLEAEYSEGIRTGWGPLVGMPCTYHIGSDHYAAVVTKVSKSGHQVHVRPEGLDEMLFTRRKNPTVRYRAAKTGSGYLSFLKAETRLDPCF